MSPERFTTDKIDGRSDLYSLGVVLYEMLTGQPPFDPTQPFMALIQQHMHDQPALPRGRSPIPERLGNLIMRMLAKDPRDRPTTASDVADELRQIDEGLRQPAPDRPAPAARRQPQGRPDHAKARKDARRLSGADPDDAATELETMDPVQAMLALEYAEPAIADALDVMNPAVLADLLSRMGTRLATSILEMMEDQRALRVMELMNPLVLGPVIQSFAYPYQTLQHIEARIAGPALALMDPGQVAKMMELLEVREAAPILAIMNRETALAVIRGLPNYKQEILRDGLKRDRPSSVS
jgi:flagellar motility protein MotE (MotC chaperone)